MTEDEMAGWHHRLNGHEWQLYFSEKLPLGYPEPPRVRASTVESKRSRSTGTGVARMSTLVISHMTSGLPASLTPPGWMGSRGKRKEKTVQANIYYLVPTMLPALHAWSSSPSP